MRLLVEASQKVSFDFAKRNLAIIMHDRLEEAERLLTTDVEALLNKHDGVSHKTETTVEKGNSVLILFQLFMNPLENAEGFASTSNVQTFSRRLQMRL